MAVEALYGCIEYTGINAFGMGQNQRVNGSKQLACTLNQCVAASCLLEVGRYELDLASSSTEFVHEFLGVSRTLFVPDPIVVGPPMRKHQVPAICGQPNGDAGADTPPTPHAGDQRDWCQVGIVSEGR
jgi:hypothetical protein